MKKVTFLFALLAIPAIAFAGTASMSLKLADGSTYIEVPQNVATNLSVVWTLDAYNDADVGGYGIANVDAYITASASNVFKITAGAWGQPFSQGAFGGGVVCTLAPLSVQLGGLAQNPNYSDPLGQGNYTTADAPLPWTLRTLTMQVQATAAPGLYSLTIPGSFAGTIDADLVAINLATSNNGGFQVRVTPEPATMLLLALALPFLRRRSA